MERGGKRGLERALLLFSETSDSSEISHHIVCWPKVLHICCRDVGGGRHRGYGQLRPELEFGGVLGRLRVRLCCCGQQGQGRLRPREALEGEQGFSGKAVS